MLPKEDSNQARAAKARGKKLGNPGRYFDKKRATELRNAGWGQIRIAKTLGVGVGTVNKWVHTEYKGGPRRSCID